MSWKKYTDDYALFLEAGYIAVNQADEDSALKLFKTAELCQPDNTLPKVGFGYLHLHKLELKQAVRVFEEVLAKEPANDMAKTLLGICISMMPDGAEKGESILKQTRKSNNEEISQLSTTAIDFVEKFVKKKPGPAGKNK